jgi:short-subunit dehydrogenase
VVATDFNFELLSDLTGKKNYLTLGLDVTSEVSVQNCVHKLSKEINQIDVLVSNAGIFSFYPVSEAGAEKLKKIIDVNVLGLTNLTKYFLPLLTVSESRLIVIGSESYKVPSPFQPYSVSKQMLESVFKAIKIELSLKGIKSILVRPGAMQTQILEDTIQFKNFNEHSQFKTEFKNFVNSVPKYIRKVSTPEDVAKVILKGGTAKHPKQVYSINHNPLVTILSGLPPRFKNFIVEKNLR